jgi:hypothetical protein
MWYAICLGAGLVFGVAFLIWALAERNKRCAVERDLNKALQSVKELELARQSLHEQLKVYRIDKEAFELQLITLRNVVNDLRKKLAECGDPEAVRKWLDEELGKPL